jgi:hypothetical protein
VKSGARPEFLPFSSTSMGISSPNHHTPVLYL